MDLNEAMEYLGNEGMRLQTIGVGRSNVVMSTFLDNGDIARLTVTVELIEANKLKKQMEEREREQEEKESRVPVPPPGIRTQRPAPRPHPQQQPGPQPYQ